jgi:hypothetical protein
MILLYINEYLWRALLDKMLLNARGILGHGQEIQELIVRDEVESWERHA